MEMHRERLVEYKMGAPVELVEKQLPPGVRKLVLVAHDESTNTANDGPKASWVLEGEQPILKKGAGCGSHRSDVICSTHGWLANAGVQLEYGKNYEGYWTGEMFVAQVILISQVYYLLWFTDPFLSSGIKSYQNLKDSMVLSFKL